MLIYKKNQVIRLLLFIFIFTVYGCKEAIDSPVAECILPENQEEQVQNEQTSGEVEVPKLCSVPAKSDSANLTVDVVLTDFDKLEEEKMLSALQRLEMAINSVEFKERILNHEYKDEKTFVDNNGLTNQEIYDLILEGAEVLNEQVDSEIDLDLTLYYKNNSTVGYTRQNTHRIWVNNKFFKDYTLAKVAKNASHEWIHKLGFGHAKYDSVSRRHSVPYAVGAIIQDIIEKM